MINVISESQFKKQFLEKLNTINPGWQDGDQEDGLEKTKTVDVVNHTLKIAIEVKDDYKFFLAQGVQDENESGSNSSNRQYKKDIKEANDKFINYPCYKTVALIRTRRGDFFIDNLVEGPIMLYVQVGHVGSNPTVVGQSRPSSFFLPHDKSIKEVGVILFWGDKKILYIKNKNQNVNKQRFIEKETLEKIMGFKLENLDK